MQVGLIGFDGGPETALDVLREFGFEKEHDILHEVMMNSPEMSQLLKEEEQELRKEEEEYRNRPENKVWPPRGREEALLARVKSARHGEFLSYSDIHKIIGLKSATQVASRVKVMARKEGIFFLSVPKKGYYILR
jgi:hypothetical protein